MRLVLTALAVLLIAPAAASAETEIQLRYHGRNPELNAAALSDTGADDVRVVEWRSCAPGGAPCGPLAESAYTFRCDAPSHYCGARALPGETAPGTSFEAVFETAGVTTTLRTPAWSGPLTSAAPASLADVAAGQTVRVLPGSWSGGWEIPDGSPAQVWQWHRLIACRELPATDCWHVPATLEQRWAGWYLMVEETHAITWPGSRLFLTDVPGIVVPPPYRTALLPLGSHETRSAPVPICCVLHAPAPAAESRRDAAPVATVRSRAQRRKGRLHVGSVRCVVRCAVRLTVRSRGGTVARSLSVQGARSLAIPRRRGTLRVRVVIDGKLVASGRSRAR